MYILASPCILNPNLRANGITTEKDKLIFSKCIERCRNLELEIVPLPCPETIFFGSNREPGPYKGRMDSEEFSNLLSKLETQVRKNIEERNESPLFILGVNSSPTCGVTKTYFTETKSEGRGVFLKRFSDLQAIDVIDFANLKEEEILKILKK